MDESRREAAREKADRRRSRRWVPLVLEEPPFSEDTRKARLSLSLLPSLHLLFFSPSSFTAASATLIFSLSLYGLFVPRRRHISTYLRAARSPAHARSREATSTIDAARGRFRSRRGFMHRQL